MKAGQELCDNVSVTCHIDIFVLLESITVIF